MRKNFQSDSPSSCSHLWLGRAFWLTLLLLHALAIPSAIRALTASTDIASQAVIVLRFAGLFASIVGFVLKIIDVPWLRIAPGWRSAVLAIVAIALLHVCVIDLAVQGDLMVNPAHVGLVLFAGSAWRLASMKRRLSRLLPLLRIQQRRSPLPLVLYRLTHADFVSLVQTFISRISVPRAPPHAL